MVKRRGPSSEGNFDGLVKSRKTPFPCHSGLSGILLFQCVITRKDSRQAGMTTFYECINFEYVARRFHPSSPCPLLEGEGISTSPPSRGMGFICNTTNCGHFQTANLNTLSAPRWDSNGVGTISASIPSERRRSSTSSMCGYGFASSP